MQGQRVLISGAGIAGLCAALWFNRFGFAVTVVERAAAPRGGGYLVSLSDYAYRAAAELNRTTCTSQGDHSLQVQYDAQP
ncbi:MAG: NAD-binding protein [Pseudomonadales bacterium]